MDTLVLLALYWIWIQLRHKREDDEEEEKRVMLLDKVDSLIWLRYLLSQGIFDKKLLLELGVRNITLLDFYKEESAKYPRTTVVKDFRYLQELARERKKREKAAIEAEALKQLELDIEKRDCKQSIQDYYFKKAI